MLACLDDDVQMASSSNNNSGDFIIRGREWGVQRGRVSPLPMRAFRGGKMPHRIRQLLAGEPNCYKIIVRLLELDFSDYLSLIHIVKVFF